MVCIGHPTGIYVIIKKERGELQREVELIHRRAIWVGGKRFYAVSAIVHKRGVEIGTWINEVLVKPNYTSYSECFW